MTLDEHKHIPVKKKIKQSSHCGVRNIDMPSWHEYDLFLVLDCKKIEICFFICWSKENQQTVNSFHVKLFLLNSSLNIYFFQQFYFFALNTYDGKIFQSGRKSKSLKTSSFMCANKRSLRHDFVSLWHVLHARTCDRDLKSYTIHK